MALAAPAAFATTVNMDTAANYSSWTDGSNEGGGFEAWNIESDSSDGFAGCGIWGSTNIDLDMGDAFGFTARGNGAYINISRDFTTALDDGDIFKLDLGLNYDAGENGRKGFVLYASDGREVIEVNQGSTSNITVNGSTVLSSYGTATMYWTFTQNSATEITVFATGRGGESEYHTETIELTEDSYIAGIRFYASSITNDAYVDYRAVFFDNLTLSQGASSDATFSYSTADGHTTITEIAKDATGALIIPATLGGSSVTSIDRIAGAGCTNIASLSFADGAAVTNIGINAFQGCTTLQVAALPSGLRSLHPALFQGCTNLASISIPSNIKSIEGSVFAGCRSLTEAVLPENLSELGESVFMNCRSLTSLEIPEGISEIPGQLCYECRALSELTLPAGLTNIGYHAFYNCRSIEELSIPASVAEVGDGAFKGCSSLKTLVFDGEISRIGDEAFYGCTSLESIYFNGSVAVLADAVFGQSPHLTRLFFKCDAPELDEGTDLFIGSSQTVIYYLADSSNWGSSLGGATVSAWGPEISAMSYTNGNFRITAEWESEGTASLQACTNLIEGLWFDVGSSAALTGGTCELSDPDASSSAVRYYRILIN